MSYTHFALGYPNEEAKSKVSITHNFITHNSIPASSFGWPAKTPGGQYPAKIFHYIRL